MQHNKLTLVGPLAIDTPALSIMAVRPVFLPGVQPSETFSQPLGVTTPANCPASLCYQPANQTKVRRRLRAGGVPVGARARAHAPSGGSRT